MDIRQLKYYCVLIEEKSYHKAAAKLHISQPALSQQITALEKELQAMLIKREGKCSLPTDIGSVLYRKAKTIIELTNTAKQEISDYGNKVVGSLRIATSCLRVLLSKNIVDFYKKYPDVFLDIREGTHGTVMELLSTDLCELALTDYEEHDSRNYRKIVLDEQKFMLCGHEKFIHKDVKEINVKDLKNIPLIINRTDGLMIRNAAINYGFEPNIVAYADSTENKINLATTGIGVALGSESCAQAGKERNLNVAKLDGIKDKIERCIFWKDDHALSLVASEFLTMLSTSKKI